MDNVSSTVMVMEEQICKTCCWWFQCHGENGRCYETDYRGKAKLITAPDHTCHKWTSRQWANEQWAEQNG